MNFFQPQKNKNVSSISKAVQITLISIDIYGMFTFCQ